MSGLFALTSPFAILTICLLLITPSTWRVPIAMSLTFLIRLPPKRFGLPAFFKDKTITSGLTFDLPIIHWSSNKPKFRILYGKCFDGWRFSKCQCMISSFPFNFFRNLYLRSTMLFVDFVCNKPQFSTLDFFRSRGDKFCDGYFFSFPSIFIFFKKIVKKMHFVHFANWSSPTLKQHESENKKTSKLKLTFESLQKHLIGSFI